MPDKKRSWLDWLVPGTAVLLLLVAYVGAYAWMVQPTIVIDFGGGTIAAGHRTMMQIYADDDFIDSILQEAFYPIHESDRLLRPSIWAKH